MTSVWTPAYLSQMGQWLSNPNISMYGRWDASDPLEGGVDLPSPGGTPVYALADGTIQGAGNFWHSADLYTPGSGAPGYGVVTTRVDVPGLGAQDLYYQHIQINPAITPCMAGNCGGQVVHKGDIIGWITPGVGELEMGFNPPWGGIWGVNHPGPWVTDPRSMIAALMGSGIPATLGTTPFSGTIASGLDPLAPLTGLFTSLQPLWDWLNNPGRLLKMIGGLLLIGISLYMLINPDATDELTSALTSGAKEGVAAA